MLEIKELKTDDEKLSFYTIADNTPFYPNKFSYSKFEYIRWGGMDYACASRSVTFIEDYYHKGYFIPKGGNYQVHTELLVRPGVRKFTKKDPDTWVRVDYNNSKYLETTDYELYNQNIHYVLVQSRSANPLEITMSENELLALGFVRGKVTKDYWFYQTEVDVLDTFLPYRKFDNTYRYVDIKSRQSQMKEDGYTPKEIQDWANKTMKENIAYGTDSITYTALEGLEYTFGVEIETCIGRLEVKEVTPLNIKAVHDGSLRDADGNTPGGEYVTGVLKGDAGLAQLSEICRVISMKCKVNHLCGVHVHLGSLNWGKDDIVYAYILAEMLEKELFAMLPPSRRNNTYCRALSPITTGATKELNKSLSKGQYSIIIDNLYDEIYREVTFIKNKNGGRDYVLRNIDPEVAQTDILINSRVINKGQNHPLGTKCGYDKNAQRYCWLNFVTLLYDTKGNPNARTLEFRSHSATMNFAKIKNWVKICFAFCRFVEAFKTTINKGDVKLADVVLSVYPKTGKDLVNYINERTQVFKTQDESIDYLEKQTQTKKSIKEVVECV